MDRRRFSRALAGALLTAPFGSRAQNRPMPTIGFLRSTPEGQFTHLVIAFREGLGQEGFVEGRNVAIEYRWGDNRRERLPVLAADLVSRRVDVIVGNSLAAEAARAATDTIPIVFVTSDDPVARGLVRSLAQPGGNVTGVTFFGGGQLGAKRFELLRELLPGANPLAYLMNPGWPGSKAELPEVEGAARAAGVALVVARASDRRELESAFAAFVAGGARGVVVGGSPVFSTMRTTLIALAARHGLAAVYDIRDYVVDGGLASYAASFTGAYRQAGIYAGRILAGAKPSELPVQQPTRLELVVNLRTAKALGIAIPPSVRLRADETIE